MDDYSTEEYCDIHYFYGRAGGNSREARRLYAEHFPNRQCPDHKTFSRVHMRLMETGTFKVSMSDTGRNRVVRDVEFEEIVLEQFEEYPMASTREVARNLGSSKSTV